MTHATTCSFSPGIHGVTIAHIKLAKDTNGKPIVNMQTGEPSIEVLYTGIDNNSGSEIIVYSDKTQWITDALSKACKVDNTDKEVNVKELVGKRLWIYVRGYYRIGDNPGTDNPVSTEIISGKYSQFFGPKPAVLDAPEYNKGIPKGMFVEFINVSKETANINLDEREFGDD